MGSKIKNVLIITLITIIIALFSVSVISVKADSGWDSDYDSSWDSGSSWDSDYDYDYDYDDDYDYDYDNDWDSGSSSSGGSSCTTEECREKSKFLIIVVFGSILAFVVILELSNLIKKIKRSINRFKVRKRNRDFIKKQKELNVKEIDEMDAKKVIENFDIEEFNFKAYQIFYDVQMAWMEFDYDKLKELLTDELYNMYVNQLESIKIKNQKNIMKGFELIKSSIYDLKEENGLYIAKVCLDVKFYDYIEDLKKGKVIRGNQYKKLNNVYKLTFIRTKEEKNNINECPRCCAPTTGNVTGICEYCKSKLVNKEYDWVMSKKEKISQK